MRGCGVSAGASMVFVVVVFIALPSVAVFGVLLCLLLSSMRPALLTLPVHGEMIQIILFQVRLIRR